MSDPVATVRTVLFVCEHGVFRSRVAAALFNSLAPDGWQAASAGRFPDGELSENARRVVSGDPGAAHLEEGAARPIGSFARPQRISAIDCDIPGADRWSLDRGDPDGIAQALRRQVADLVADDPSPKVTR